MNKKLLWKKGLIIGIIFILLLSTTPIMIGYTVQKDNQISDEQNILNLGNFRPDLKIISARETNNPWGFPICYITVKNFGFGAVPSWTGIECTCTIKKLFKNEVVCFISKTWYPINPFEQGEVKEVGVGDFCVDDMPMFFYGRIFFHVDPNDNIDESNEYNNKAWAYVQGRAYSVEDNWCRGCNYDIGEVRQGLPNNVDNRYIPFLKKTIEYSIKNILFSL